MDILYCILFTAALGLLLHWGVMIQLERRRRTCIGLPIFRSLRFKGMEYEFVGIVPTRYKDRIGENELYLEPGFLYTTGAGLVALNRRGTSSRPR